MTSINTEKLWNNLMSYPEVSNSQKEQQQIYYTIHFSPYTNFGSIKDVLHNVSEEKLDLCIEELYMMPTLDGGDDEDEVNDDFRFFLHGNMFHEISRIDRLYTHSWHATPKRKKKKRAFF